MGIMMESNELNISEITRRSGISHSSVEVHLELLVERGILTEKRFNRIRIFKVDGTSPMVGALTRFMDDWRRANDYPPKRSFS